MHTGTCSRCLRESVPVNARYANNLCLGNWCADCFERWGPLKTPPRGRPRRTGNGTPASDGTPPSWDAVVRAYEEER